MEVRSGYASASLPFIQKKKKIKMYNFAFSLRDHYTQKGILPLKPLYIITLIIIILFSCKETEKKSIEKTAENIFVKFPITIDLVKIIDKESKEIKLSNIVDSIEYITLETTPDALIGFIRDIDVTDSFVFICTEGKILKFNRKGRFLYQIGSIGKGPGQWPLIRNISIDDKKKIIYVFPNGFSRKLIKYSYDNKYIGDIHLFNSDLASLVSFIGNNHFIASGIPMIWWEINKNMFLTAIIDSTGTIIRKIDSPLKQLYNFKKKNNIRYWGTYFPSYYDSIALILGIGCDTVYAVTSCNIKPKYILNSGKFKMPTDIIYGFSNDLEQRLKISKKRFNYFVIVDSPIETYNYLIIKFYLKGYMYLAVFDKIGGKSIVFKKKGKVKYGGVVNMQELGFKNDIDGGLNFFPSWFNLKGDLWIKAYDAIELKDQLDKIKQAKGVKYPNRQKALIKLIENLKYTDNPVIAIAHVKNN